MVWIIMKCYPEGPTSRTPAPHISVNWECSDHQRCILLWIIPIVAITKYYKPRGLKYFATSLLVLYIGSLIWVLLGYNQGVSRAVFFLETVGQNPFLDLFQLLEATYIPGLWPSLASSKPELYQFCSDPFLQFSIWAFVHLSKPRECMPKVR